MLRTTIILFVFFIFGGDAAASVYRLSEEPTIRIGLATNARSIAISTGDTELTAGSASEPQKFLAVKSVSVAARAYRPPQIEIYHLEISGIETRANAEQISREIREATGENAVYSLESMPDVWKIRIGTPRDSFEDAAVFRDLIAEKGFEDAKITVEKKSQPSAEAIQLSSKNNLPNVTVIDPNLREVVVSGASPAAKYASLTAVSFGSTDERNVPVRVGGKSYRGRIEVFVNSRNTLTVVNVVRMEDYVRGVVPNELGFPSLEAQKAQAIAARTYAVKNIGQFSAQGFDLLPTIRSQVYNGFSSENATATRAVSETRGIVATFDGKPINAMYTSTCGGRTENSENVFDFNEPYLRGVECSLDGDEHFATFLIKSNRETPKIDDDANVENVRRAAILAVNNFQISARFSDDYFSDAPNENELRNWLNLTAAKLNAPAPIVNAETAKPTNLAMVLAAMLYGADHADTMLSASDVNYHLSFADGDKIIGKQRANTAILLRDGWLSLYGDATLKPEKNLSRARIINTIWRLAERKKWFPALASGVTKPSENGKLIVQSGRSTKILSVRADAFLLRQFGDALFQVKEIALVGGEAVSYHTDAAGNIDYLEAKPTSGVTTAEKMSPLALWSVNLSPSAVQARLSRYVRGIGSLYDVRIKQKGFSRRATELEIVGSNGIKTLVGGKIRSALRLKEQLFVLNKKYGANGNVTAYNFTGRGWGHGVGMCQYGAFGLAKMGVKSDRIIKHYYSGVELTRMY